MKSIAKITFLIVTGIFFTNSKIQAQCTPASSLPGFGIFPDTMAQATRNISYQQVMQFEAPIDTMITVPNFGKVNAKIDSIKITNVLGLPSGFTYQCNTSNCKVNGGEIGCVLMSGTTSQTGNYPLKVLIHTYGRANVLGSWLTMSQTDTNAHYFILVNNPTGIFELIDRSQPIKVYPNPAQNKLYIDAKPIGTSSALVKVFDVQGKLLMENPIDVYNNPSIDISILHSGIYFSEISDGTKIFRAKFIVK